MATVVFTPHLRQHVPGGAVTCDGDTIRNVLERACSEHPTVRGYVFDDQGRLRRHVCVFAGGRRLTWRDSLEVAVAPEGELFVMQALSGG
jgi:hypothetical protein